MPTAAPRSPAHARPPGPAPPAAPARPGVLLPVPPLLLALALLLVAGLFIALAGMFTANTVDDAWITFRYSRQWALGHGPYFNPGEHVEGYSNFLLMLVLTPVIAWGGAGAALPAAKAIGLASGVLAVLGAGVLARRAAGDTPWAGAAAIAAAGIVACVPGFAYHAMSGLETALYAALLTWGVVGLTSARPRAILLGGVALAAAAITRPEGPAMFALAWLTVAGAMLLRRARDRRAGTTPAAPAWRPLVLAAIAGAGTILGQLAFRYAFYDGELVPNTYFAKLGGSGDRIRYVVDAVREAFLGPLGLLLAGLGVVLGGRAPRAWWTAALLGIAGALLPLALGGDWMHGSRLVMPYVPLLAAAVACAWGRLLGAARGIGAAANLILVLTVPIAFAIQARARDALASTAAIETTGARSGHGGLATWLAAQARPGEQVVLMDIGEVGYHAIAQRIVDVTGLTDRVIARSPGTFMAKTFDLAYVFDRRPEFIVLTFFGRGDLLAAVDAGAPLYPFSEMESRLASHPAFERDYFRAPPAAPAAAGLAGLDGLRRFFGADAVFPYATPGRRYVLVAYRRKS